MKLQVGATASSSQDWQTIQNGAAERYYEKVQISAEEFVWVFVRHWRKWLSSPKISSAAMLLNCKSHDWEKLQAENVALCWEKGELQNDKNKKTWKKARKK